MKKRLIVGHLLFILSFFSCDDESDRVGLPYNRPVPATEGFSIQPVAGPAGTYITIIESNLFQDHDNVMIQFGTVNIGTIATNPDRIGIKVPGNLEPGSYTVGIIINGQTVSYAQEFEVTSLQL